MSIERFTPLHQNQHTRNSFTMKFHAFSLLAFSAATLASPVEKRQNGSGKYGAVRVLDTSKAFHNMRKTNIQCRYKRPSRVSKDTPSTCHNQLLRASNFRSSYGATVAAALMERQTLCSSSRSLPTAIWPSPLVPLDNRVEQLPRL